MVTMDALDTLISIAVDLTAALSAKDRYLRLLEALQRIIPYDAAALLRVEGDSLQPLAARGLLPDTLGRQFKRADHPRLDIICNAGDPIIFPPGSSLPDPFDGLLDFKQDRFEPIHACLGCPLRVHDTLVGVLTADALAPHAFDALDLRFLKGIGALAGAQMQIADLIAALERTVEHQGLITSDLLQDIGMQRGAHMIGASTVMEHLRREIDLVARSDFTIMVLGETGVGKELVVRAIHKASHRSGKPILYLNCAALPETLAESELFGHKKGAFTGAVQDRAGKFELADGGTLFLDEIGELPLSIQAKLLRTIQEGEVQRVGSEKTIQVDVRLLVATNRDLKQEVESGRFRADLFHRLNVYPLSVPPLRERKGDIPLLAGFFCEKIRRRLGLGPVRTSPDVLEQLNAFDWPGNVRELENVISRILLKAAFGAAPKASIVIQPMHLGGDLAQDRQPTTQLPEAYTPPLSKAFSLREETVKFQKHLIQTTLAQHDSNWSAAARVLGMHRSNLYHLAKRLNLK